MFEIMHKTYQIFIRKIYQWMLQFFIGLWSIFLIPFIKLKELINTLRRTRIVFPDPASKSKSESKSDAKPKPEQKVKPKKAVNPEECTICFDTRIQTYMFYPCGHATFCKDCAFHLFKKKKNCPDCRGLIKDTVRVYQ